VGFRDVLVFACFRWVFWCFGVFLGVFWVFARILGYFACVLGCFFGNFEGVWGWYNTRFCVSFRGVIGV